LLDAGLRVARTHPTRAMTTSPEDAAALFDLPPPAESPPDESTTAAEEAALAAELAAIIESGGVAGDAPDSRTDSRVKVSWSARMRLPDGRAIDVKVRDISEGGVGLMSGQHIPADTVMDFEVAVPSLDDDGTVRSVKGTIKTTYTVGHGSEFLGGATWQSPPDGLELVHRWIQRHWR
jgi:hypothetical protein